jgi:hypothetical protein
MKESIIIFSDSQEKAEIKMNELVKSTNEQSLRRRDRVETETKIFRAVKWSQNQRACKAHEIYIDLTIDSKEVEMCIIPCLINQFNENYNWKNHIHYF